MTTPAADPDDRRRAIAFWLFVGAAAVDVLVVLLGLTHIGSTVAAARSRPGTDPATVGIYSFIGAEYADWDHVMAFASVFALPVLILFLLLQRKIVAGLTTGALK